MDVALGIAAVLSVLLAIGHTALGVIWVLPSLTEERVPKTPFGPAGLTVSMLRVTWYIVTILVVASGAILMTLAWAPDADPRTVVLRWFAAMWFAATAMAFWVVVRRARSLRAVLRSGARLPVPFLWLVIAVICWKASL